MCIQQSCSDGSQPRGRHHSIFASSQKSRVGSVTTDGWLTFVLGISANHELLNNAVAGPEELVSGKSPMLASQCVSSSSYKTPTSRRRIIGIFSCIKGNAHGGLMTISARR